MCMRSSTSGTNSAGKKPPQHKVICGLHHNFGCIRLWVVELGLLLFTRGQSTVLAKGDLERRVGPKEEIDG